MQFKSISCISAWVSCPIRIQYRHAWRGNLYFPIKTKTKAKKIVEGEKKEINLVLHIGNRVQKWP